MDSAFRRFMWDAGVWNHRRKFQAMGIMSMDDMQKLTFEDLEMLEIDAKRTNKFTSTLGAWFGFNKIKLEPECVSTGECASTGEGRMPANSNRKRRALTDESLPDHDDSQQCGLVHFERRVAAAKLTCRKIGAVQSSSKLAPHGPRTTEALDKSFDQNPSPSGALVTANGHCGPHLLTHVKNETCEDRPPLVTANGHCRDGPHLLTHVKNETCEDRMPPGSPLGIPRGLNRSIRWTQTAPSGNESARTSASLTTVTQEVRRGTGNLNESEISEWNSNQGSGNGDQGPDILFGNWASAVIDLDAWQDVAGAENEDDELQNLISEDDDLGDDEDDDQFDPQIYMELSARLTAVPKISGSLASRNEKTVVEGLNGSRQCFENASAQVKTEVFPEGPETLCRSLIDHGHDLARPRPRPILRSSRRREGIASKSRGVAALMLQRRKRIASKSRGIVAPLLLRRPRLKLRSPQRLEDDAFTKFRRSVAPLELKRKQSDKFDDRQLKKTVPVEICRRHLVTRVKVECRKISTSQATVQTKHFEPPSLLQRRPGMTSLTNQEGKTSEDKPTEHGSAKYVAVTCSAKKMPHSCLDEDGMLVVYKPPFWTVTTTADRREVQANKSAIQNWVWANFGKKYKFIAEDCRAGLVHRLDVQTSGPLLIGSSSKAYDGLRAALYMKKWYKEYLALVHGKVPLKDSSGVLRYRLLTAKQGGGPGWLTQISDRGEYAESRYESVAAYSNKSPCGRMDHFTLIRLHLVTGKTHQIRVHLKEFARQLGLPVHGLVGDYKYLSPSQARFDRKICSRVFLHEHRLHFPSLGKESTHSTVRIFCPLPADLRKTLGSLEFHEEETKAYELRARLHSSLPPVDTFRRTAEK